MIMKWATLIIGLAAWSVCGQTKMSTIMANYTNYNIPLVADNTIEINSILGLSGVESNVDQTPTNVPLVLILVEPRLMNAFTGSKYQLADLQFRLKRFKQDLSNDGKYGLVLSTSVYAGAVHQDGLTAMALRRFLKDVKANYALEGVIFVGRFPECSYVLRIAWPYPIGAVRDLTTNTVVQDFTGDKEIFMVCGGMTGNRSDIPIADLDGNWENVYHLNSMAIEQCFIKPTDTTWQTGWNQTSFTVSGTKYAFQTSINPSFADFFYVNDAVYTTPFINNGTISTTVTTARPHNEISAADLARPSPMALPDIYVSRINPYSAAYEKSATWTDRNGQTLYDASGKPQTVSDQPPPETFSQDLERTLLVEYFDNNHLFRTGSYYNQPFDFGSATNELCLAVDAAYQLKIARHDWGKENDAVNTAANVSTTKLNAYADWLNQNVPFRIIETHANWNTNAFTAPDFSAMLTSAGTPYDWVQNGSTWSPSWTNNAATAGYVFYRSLWKNKKISASISPSLVLNGGCFAASPGDDNGSRTYLNYASGQVSECNMFYGKAIGIIARSKEYNDNPIGWQSYTYNNPNAMFGDIWKKYYDTLSIRPNTWQIDGFASAKRPYWWVLFGDYTLKLRYTPCANANGGGSGYQGTAFGASFSSYAPGSEFCMASDGDINSFYDCSQGNGAYTGLDLGTAKVIGSIRFYPRPGFASRMVGGKFQGSNTSNSSGFVDLYTISTTPANGQWTNVVINSGSYRYVRYLAPNNSYGNITEMEFGGNQYYITAIAGANGSISPSGAIWVNSGDSKTFTFTPNSGYQINAVKVDGSNKGPVFSYTFSNVTANHNISVSFKAYSDPCAEVQGGGGGLNGTPFGTIPPYATGSEYCKATDGNTSTFFDAIQADGGYTGLDLGDSKGIGTIRFYPRSGFASRMVGGKFQGSNTSSSTGYVDLYTITTAPAEGQWSSINLNAAPYRYVRYIAANGNYCNIAEMEFTGYQYYIIANAGANGSISPNGAIWVNDGDNKTYTFTPNSGYQINAVKVDGVDQGAITSYTFSNIMASHNISVTFKTYSDPCTGVQGGGSGFTGSTFGLTPPYSTGFEYCKSTDGDISTFYDAQQADGAYTGIDLGTAKVIGKIRFYPRSGFGSRMNGGKFQGSNTSNSSGFVDLYTIPSTPAVQWNEVTIPNATAYRWVRYLAPSGSYGNIAEMEFYAPVQYTITASADANGSISPSGSVLVTGGSSQTFTITPNNNYDVSSVIIDGVNQGVIYTYTFQNVNANHTISATFKNGTFNITSSAGSGGTISPSGSIQVTGNSNQTFTISPSSGYVINTVFVDGTNVGAVTSYTFTNVTANHSIAAMFKPIVYTITASAGANGTISPSGSVSVNSGTTQSFTITPNSGYAVSGVTVDGSNQGAINTYTFGNVNANHTISATFAAQNASKYEAENAALSGSANKNTNHTGYSGTGFVDGFFNSTTAQASFSVNVASAGSYVLTLHYSAGNGTSTNTGLYVNGTKLKSISCPVTANWNTWADETEIVTLNAGSNTIAYKADASSSSCINLDFITLTYNGTPSYTITASAGTNGTISPSGSISVTLGGSKNFTITPNSGYQVNAVTIDGTNQGAVTTYTFTNVTANHTIAATFTTNNGVYEAENATLSGGAAKNTNHSGYSGTGFVDGFFNSSTAKVTFSITVATAGSYTAKLHYSAGNGTSTNTGLYVNGVYIKNISCPGTSNWDTWADQTETVTLFAGNNTIEYLVQNSSSSCINLDKLTLTVTSCTPPTIVSSPASASICVGNSAIMNVNASGATSWQWYKGSTALTNSSYYAGAQAAKLTITASDNSVAGSYYCVCSNGSCSANSGSATLTINAQPVITSNPSNTSICETYGNATMSVSATGATQYEWHDANGILTDSKYYTGTTTATLRFVYIPYAWNGSTYYCVVKNSAGCSVTSSSAMLTVYPTTEMNSIWNSSWYNHQGAGGNPNGNFWVQVDAPSGTTAYVKITNPVYPQFNRTTQVTGQTWPEVSSGNTSLPAGTITVEYWCVNASGCESSRSFWTNPAW